MSAEDYTIALVFSFFLSIWCILCVCAYIYKNKNLLYSWIFSIFFIIWSRITPCTYLPPECDEDVHLPTLLPVPPAQPQAFVCNYSSSVGISVIYKYVWDVFNCTDGPGRVVNDSYPLSLRILPLCVISVLPVCACGHKLDTWGI